MSELPMLRKSALLTDKKFNLVGIAGELLVTAGVLVLLFLGWQLWFNDIVVGASQSEAASELSEEWMLGPTAKPGETPEPQPAAASPSTDEPVVMATPTTKAAFATLLIPRLGVDYKRTISQGVSFAVLNDRAAGVGHYPETQMPGQVGNFAVAAHRTTYGRSFHDINLLGTGDRIYVETADGWYQYVYRNTEYVFPTGVGVIAPVPQLAGVDPNDRIITMTSCNPYFSSAERIVAYGVLEAWYPRAGGAPAELVEMAEEAAN